MPKSSKPRAKREFVRVGFRLPAELMETLTRVSALTGVGVEDQVRAAVVRLVSEIALFDDLEARLRNAVAQADAPEAVRTLPEAEAVSEAA